MQNVTIPKFTWAEALPNKTCDLVSNFLEKLFHTFGPPRILQCDNGGEFTGNILKSMLAKYFPEVQLRHSTPRPWVENLPAQKKSPPNLTFFLRPNQTLRRKKFHF